MCKVLQIEDLTIQNVSIMNAAEFTGVHIHFLVNNQRFQFLVGNSQSPIPLGIKHTFSKKDTCSLCNKKINAVPVGQQLCFYLQKNRQALLDFFLKNYPSHF
ncbi:hypothetical protein [Aquibacillus saliphilus]|uniref:hypothetical protein n=1 Tax=Aquibacillus saliphilus TaxID=1909422 RepID=UPI001CF0B71B|nr:hypothetical protein [Aquibacillus saliphilus]